MKWYRRTSWFICWFQHWLCFVCFRKQLGMYWWQRLLSGVRRKTRNLCQLCWHRHIWPKWNRFVYLCASHTATPHPGSNTGPDTSSNPSPHDSTADNTGSDPSTNDESSHACANDLSANPRDNTIGRQRFDGMPSRFDLDVWWRRRPIWGPRSTEIL